jgi:hypothetical protein
MKRINLKLKKPKALRYKLNKSPFNTKWTVIVSLVVLVVFGLGLGFFHGTTKALSVGSVSKNGTMKVVLKMSESIQSFGQDKQALGFSSISPDGKIAYFENGYVSYQYDVATDQLIKKYTIPTGENRVGIYSGLSYSNDGQSIYIINRGATLFSATMKYYKVSTATGTSSTISSGIDSLANNILPNLLSGVSFTDHSYANSGSNTAGDPVATLAHSRIKGYISGDECTGFLSFGCAGFNTAGIINEYQLNSQTNKFEKTGSLNLNVGNVITNLVYSPDDKYLYALVGRDNLYKIDTSTNSVVSKIGVGSGGQNQVGFGSSLASSHSSSDYFLLLNGFDVDASQVLSRIDGQTNSVVDSFNFGDTITDISITPDDKFAYVMAGAANYKISLGTTNTPPNPPNPPTPSSTITKSSQVVGKSPSDRTAKPGDEIEYNINYTAQTGNVADPTKVLTWRACVDGSDKIYFDHTSVTKVDHDDYDKIGAGSGCGGDLEGASKGLVAGGLDSSCKTVKAMVSRSYSPFVALPPGGSEVKDTKLKDADYTDDGLIFIVVDDDGGGDSDYTVQFSCADTN